MNKTYRYPYKIWLTSILVAPFLMLSLSTQPNLVQYFFSIGYLQFYLVAILIGAFISVPSVLFLWLCYAWMIRMLSSTLFIRLLILPICLLCCIVTFILFSLPDLSRVWTHGNITLMGCYCFPIICGVMFYKMEIQK